MEIKGEYVFFVESNFTWNGSVSMCLFDRHVMEVFGEHCNAAVAVAVAAVAILLEEDCGGCVVVVREVEQLVNE